MTTIVQAAPEYEIDDARHLLRGFAAWRRERHSGDIAPDERHSEEREFENELAELPGRYVPPQGRLLIAYEADQPAGCAALRNRGDGACEAEAIFVTGRFRGQRVGRALVERLLLEARGAGYRRMCLRTSIHENEAIRLCEHAGFHQISLDHEGGDQRRDQGLLFERDLRLSS